eukprot:7225779-Pyramimonas_sp.AAC.1
MSVPNQCCVCGLVFAHRESCRRHLSLSLRRGECAADATRNRCEIRAPSCLACPLCPHVAGLFEHLQENLCTHLENVPRVPPSHGCETRLDDRGRGAEAEERARWRRSRG